MRISIEISDLLTYHDGHWVGCQIKPPVTGSADNDSLVAGLCLRKRVTTAYSVKRCASIYEDLLAGEGGRDRRPSIGGAQASVGQERRHQHAPPGGFWSSNRVRIASIFQVVTIAF